jgi:hypothetical protein
VSSGHQPEKKQQPPQWKSSYAHPEEARQVCSTVKSMFTVLLNFCRVVHHESVSQGQTVSHHYNSDTLQCLWEICGKNDMKSVNQFPNTSQLVTLLCLCIIYGSDLNECHYATSVLVLTRFTSVATTFFSQKSR